MQKIVAIIQARMGSTRLQGKIVVNIDGYPMLWHVVRRVQQAKRISHVMVATSLASADNAVEQFCLQEQIACFRGNEQDVLDRYYQAARHGDADAIVRITADCPLIDPTVIDQVIDLFATGNYDYVSNTLEPTYPDGLDVEVFSYQALRKAWEEAQLPSDREHVTPYIWRQPTLFRIGTVKHTRNLSHLRWTVDEPEDLAFVRQVYELLDHTSFFGMSEVLTLLEQHPELQSINAQFERNEGYQKSLREDKEKELLKL